MNPLLNRTGLSEQVATALRASILEQQLAPGSLLPSEPTLALHFGVSRPVIREAVRILATQGVVRTEHGRGLVVVEYTGRPLLDLLAFSAWRQQIPARSLWETRRVLEVSLAGLAAERRTADDLDKMRQPLERMRLCAETGSNDDVDADVELHWAIARGAHNEFLALLMEPVAQMTREVSNALYAHGLGRMGGVGAPRQAADWPLWVFKSHQRIFEGISDQDPEAARQAMLAHLDFSSARWEVELSLTVNELLSKHDKGRRPQPGADGTSAGIARLFAGGRRKRRASRVPTGE